MSAVRVPGRARLAAMDVAAVSPFQLGWAVMGFGVIAWFVWRRHKVGPMTRGATVGYAALLGGSAAVIAIVLTGGSPIAILPAIVVGVATYALLTRS